MSIESVVASGLCMQCGTCAGICPQEAVTMNWT
ncbi:MAG: 4Fe-4S binding protein, partial [Actinobacteria bacterium]|nr:4Fe-4S binding protein [Actinomycetota bacterium]